MRICLALLFVLACGGDEGNPIPPSPYEFDQWNGCSAIVAHRAGCKVINPDLAPPYGIHDPECVKSLMESWAKADSRREWLKAHGCECIPTVKRQVCSEVP